MLTCIHLNATMYPSANEGMTMNTCGQVKTPKEVKEEFIRKGLSVSEWAKAHGFNRGLVHAVLRGERSCLRGDSHKIAVLLGIKDGVIEDDDCVPCSAQSAQAGAQSTKNCAPL
ncbi:DNA-binding protein [Methylocaldum gracile subsp. desertum]|uniref:DNA-binding protein n=1 Tax=Methylocaldum sp. GT1BW TaxID=3438964 RepID=UPI003DA0493E